MTARGLQQGRRKRVATEHGVGVPVVTIAKPDIRPPEPTVRRPRRDVRFIQLFGTPRHLPLV